MALLITSIQVDHLADLHVRAEEAWKGGADGIEIRLDTFRDDPAQLAEYLRSRREHLWILTCRSAGEGGRSKGTAADRAALLAAAQRGTNAYVDFEHRNWRNAAELRDALRAVDTASPDQRARLILSHHSFDRLPNRMEQTVEEMLATDGVAVAKVAYRARDICESFAALDLMHHQGSRVTAICMGEEGAWSRILAAKLGAFCSYCGLTADAVTAPGQVSLGEMIEQYRWPEIDSTTRLYGVIGDPVAHSMGPLLFNRWFSAEKINALYLPLRVAKDPDCLGRFLDGCVARPWLDIGGVSVTVPHKTGALRWVASSADRLCGSIGAVNTLAFSEGDCRGYNTDCHAAVASIVESLGADTAELANLPVDVLGCGGAARAVIAGLRQHGSTVTVFARSREKADAVARAFDCEARPWGDRTKRSGAVVVNCTSIGMWPHANDSPIPSEALKGCRLVFDLVYNPLETELLKQAAAAGIAALGGLDMFLRQAAMQFELWTSIEPDLQQARKLVLCQLSNDGFTEPRP